MFSRDQANKAADSLLEPPQRELAERRKKLADRQTRTFDLRRSPLVPAAAAAGVALLAMDLVSDKSYAFAAGAVAGWVFGIALKHAK